MNILLTGATGYIGKRLLPVLVNNGHKVYCCVRDVNRFSPPKSIQDKIHVIELDMIDNNSLTKIPKDIDGAFYLVHSMSSTFNYQELEIKSARNFRNAIKNSNIQHVIYLSGIVNDNSLSKHLSSRKQVEHELAKGNYNFTTLRAGIIIGSGSASFEIIRDLVEKLPIMITPKWLHTRCQPIAVSDVIKFLDRALFSEETYGENFDVGGSEILSYKNMLLRFAKIRGVKRHILVVPIMTPKLSSYWLYFISTISFKLASALVDSMKIEVVCRDDRINRILDVNPITYNEALQKTISEIEENQIVSSWKDAFISGNLEFSLSDFINVPTFGCYKDKRKKLINNRDSSISRIWQLGGDNGWYYATWLWKFRGFLDKSIGGVGLRRGRTNASEISAGDALDFWRVLYANKKEGRLLLFAEMKLPGEAWLEFKITNDELEQTATFRPKGVWGRLYWYTVYPIHGFIFNGIINKLSI